MINGINLLTDQIGSIIGTSRQINLAIDINRHVSGFQPDPLAAKRKGGNMQQHSNPKLIYDVNGTPPARGVGVLQLHSMAKPARAKFTPYCFWE